jgi:rod shape-determining protein MreC
VAVYRRTSRTRYLLAVLVLAAVTLVTLDTRSSGTGFLSSIRGAARAVVDPIQSAAHSALQPVGNFLTGVVDYGSLRAENQRLRRQIASMQAQAAASAAAQAEAQAVLSQAHLSFAAGVSTVTAQVINRGSSNFDSVYEINRGSTAGLALGYPVVAAGGLVGTVSSVTSHDATITVLTDPSFDVGVAIPHSSSVGVASGYGQGNPLHVADVPVGTVVHRGQVLSTSGLQFEKFPPGIPVGRVESVSTPAGSLQENITLAPLVDPSQQAVVTVLVWSGQTPGGKG